MQEEPGSPQKTFGQTLLTVLDWVMGQPGWSCKFEPDAMGGWVNVRMAAPNHTSWFRVFPGEVLDEVMARTCQSLQNPPRGILARTTGRPAQTIQRAYDEQVVATRLESYLARQQKGTPG